MKNKVLFKRVFIHNDYSCVLGGVEEQIRILGDFFKSQNIEVNLLFNSDTYHGYTNIEDFYFKCSDNIYIGTETMSLSNLKKELQIKNNKETLVISFKPLAFRFFNPFFMNTKILLQFRGDSSHLYDDFFSQVFDELYFDYFALMSDKMVDHFGIRNYLVGDRVINFSTYYDFKKVSIDIEKKYNSNKILVVSRISREKNLEEVIEIAEYIKKKKLNLEVDIYGDYANKRYQKYYKELLKLIEEKELDGIVNFMGYCDSLEEKMLECKLVLHCSKTEGIPRGIIEASNCYTPSIVKNSFTMASEVTMTPEYAYDTIAQAQELLDKVANASKNEYKKMCLNVHSISQKYILDPNVLTTKLNDIYQSNHNKTIEKINRDYLKSKFIPVSTPASTPVPVPSPADKRLIAKNEKLKKRVESYEKRKVIIFIKKFRKLTRIDKK